MLCGIINVNKSKGYTSHQVVSRLRKILNIKKIGHTGTLDPLAAGVLPVCAGRFTRVIEYLNTSKSYRAYFLLGVKTDTYDIEGTIIDQKAVIPDYETIKKNLNEFIGEIEQTPPMYSAVHYKGKRLYEYARKNIEIDELPKRKVKIKDIRFVDIQNQYGENPVIIVDIDCSGGTYIRSIANDLGEKLGYGCCLKDLIRTSSGKFLLKDSFTLEQIEEYVNRGDIEKILINPVEMIDLEVIEISFEQVEKIKNGQSYILEGNKKEGFFQLVFENRLAAIAEFKDKKIKPVKVFYQ